MGFALRLVWLWQKRAYAAKPWADLVDSIEPQVAAMFQASISMLVGNGQSTLSWTDKWIAGGSPLRA